MLFSQSENDRTRGSGHELLKQGRVCLKVRRLFTVRVTERWHGMLREAVEPPSLEVFQSHLDVVWDSWV